MPRLGINVPQLIKQAIYRPIFDEMSKLKKSHTHAELGKIFDVNRSMINNIVNGDIHTVSLDKLIPIANKLGIEINITTTVNGEDTVTQITK